MHSYMLEMVNTESQLLLLQSSNIELFGSTEKRFSMSAASKYSNKHHVSGVTSVLFPFSVHKWWIGVARVIVFCLWPCFYVRSCHIEAVVPDEGNAEVLLRYSHDDRVWRQSFPWVASRLPSWLLCHFTPCLGWILARHRGLYLTHGCSDSIPLPHHFASPRVHTANKLLRCGGVYVCRHTSFFFSFFLNSPFFFW